MRWVSICFVCGRGPTPARSRGAPPPREDRASGPLLLTTTSRPRGPATSEPATPRTANPRPCKKSRLDRSTVREVPTVERSTPVSDSHTRSLLVYGMGWLDFGITSDNRLPRCSSPSDPGHSGRPCAIAWSGAGVKTVRSALISGSRCAWCSARTGAELGHPAGGGSPSRQLRDSRRGKHLFNPTNGGIVAMLLLTTRSGWRRGNGDAGAVLVLLLACAGYRGREPRGARVTTLHRLLLRADVGRSI